jgi:hypothetical protein
MTNPHRRGTHPTEFPDARTCTNPTIMSTIASSANRGLYFVNKSTRSMVDIGVDVGVTYLFVTAAFL